MFNNMLMGAAGQSLSGSGGYAVENSALFVSGNSEYLSRANSGTPTSTNEFTISWWWKDCNPDYTSNTNYTHFGMSPTANFFYVGVGAGASSGTFEFNVYSKDSSGTLRTDYAIDNLCDPHAWNHFVVAIDTDQGTSGNRKRMYRNGVEVTKRASSDFGSGVTFPGMANGESMYWAYNGSSGAYMDGYFAQCAFVDGQQLTPSDFGEYSSDGVWRPIDLSGLTFGNYGYWLKFEDSSNVGLDSSGNSNSFTNNNTVTQTNDSPTKNYAVLTPLTDQTNADLSDGNTTTTTASADQGLTFSSFPVTTGQKVYIEATCSGATSCMTGCVKSTSLVAQNPQADFDALASANNGDARLLHVGLGDVFNSDGNTTVTNYAPNDSVPVTHMIALDLVNDKIYWGDAGVGASGWSDGSGNFNQAFSSAVGVDLNANLDWFFAFRPFLGTIKVNFGATAFTVDPPTGYSSGYSAAIENENREAALTVEDGSSLFQTTLYTGNGSTQTITQSGFNSTFQPDMIWEKQRDGIQEHTIFDAVRGTTKYIQPDNAGAEGTQSGVTAFNSDPDGFNLGSWAVLNENTKSHCAWQWKAGDSNTAVSASGSGDGAINACTHRANQTAGFSIVKYTGANSQISNGQDTKVTHGLGAKPDLAFIKNIDATDDWMVFSTSTSGFAADAQTGDDAHLHLNTNDAINGSLYTGHFETGSDSTHFEVGNENAVNTNGEEYIAYVFKSIPGYSKVGSYRGGANSTNGIYVHLGFSPSWLLLKDYNNGEEWYLFDNLRPGYNRDNFQLIPSTTSQEGAGEILDLLSSGFKIRANDRAYGGSSATDGYLYLAFAENPFAGSTPVTAR